MPLPISLNVGFISELKTWDGCYNFRPMRGYEQKYTAAMQAGKVAEAITYLSVHSWGCAVDVNAFENGLGKDPKLSAGFVKCFTDAGFDWGGTWKRKDGMHFQLSRI
jgi:D-alanyl-D-alanine dipeptidase